MFNVLYNPYFAFWLFSRFEFMFCDLALWSICLYKFWVTIQFQLSISISFNCLYASNLSLYNLHCLNIHLLFPKNLEIEIFRKNISSFEFRHLQKIMLSIKPNHSQYFACVFASEKFICFQDGHQMVNENSTKICSMLTNKQYKWYPQQLVNHI